MSLRALIMAMGATVGASFVGQAGSGETSDSVPLPVGAAAGDYCIFIYFPSRTISGGSGTAWNVENVLSSTVKLAHRVLEAGDISTPITLSDVSPVVTIVFRGVTGISAERTSVFYTGSSETMAGFTKSPNAAAILGLFHATGDFGNGGLSGGSIAWDGADTRGNAAWHEAMYYMINAADYTNGSGFAANGSATPANKYASVIEVLI